MMTSFSLRKQVGIRYTELRYQQVLNQLRYSSGKIKQFIVLINDLQLALVGTMYFLYERSQPVPEHTQSTYIALLPPAVV